MVYLSETIIDQIKEAEGEQQIKVIINNHSSELKIKSENGCIDKKYTLNILMALKYTKTHEAKPRALNNISIAIEIIRELHTQATENVFRL